MTDTARCFRSGNTLRISLSRYVRHMLRAEPGDLLRIDSTQEGTATIQNMGHEARKNAKGKKK